MNQLEELNRAFLAGELPPEILADAYEEAGHEKIARCLRTGGSVVWFGDQPIPLEAVNWGANSDAMWSGDGTCCQPTDCPPECLPKITSVQISVSPPARTAADLRRN